MGLNTARIRCCEHVFCEIDRQNTEILCKIPTVKPFLAEFCPAHPNRFTSAKIRERKSMDNTSIFVHFERVRCR